MKAIARLKQYIDYKGLTNSSFEKKNDLSNGYIATQIKRNADLGESILIKILDNCLDLNPLWLLTGNGTMLKEEEANTISAPDGVGDGVPTGYYYPDVSASAGLDISLSNYEKEKIAITIPGWERGIDFINVYGDSMHPRFSSGEVIGIKMIEFQYLNYGYPYVIVFNNGDVYIKYVKKGRDEHHLTLVSENTFYEPKEFHISLIKMFYSIKGVIKKEMM